MIGLGMQMDIVTKNSILLFEYAVLARHEQDLSVLNALLDACHKHASALPPASRRTPYEAVDDSPTYISEARPGASRSLSGADQRRSLWPLHVLHFSMNSLSGIGQSKQASLLPKAAGWPKYCALPQSIDVFSSKQLDAPVTPTPLLMLQGINNVAIF